MTDRTRENLSAGVICGTTGATIGVYLHLLLGLSFLTSQLATAGVSVFLILPIWHYLVAKFAHTNTKPLA